MEYGGAGGHIIMHLFDLIEVCTVAIDSNHYFLEGNPCDSFMLLTSISVISNTD